MREYASLSLGPEPRLSLPTTLFRPLSAIVDLPPRFSVLEGIEEAFDGSAPRLGALINSVLRGIRKTVIHMPD